MTIAFNVLYATLNNIFL